MTKEIVSIDQAPRAIGPYSQAVKACKLVFLPGQIPLDPVSGEPVAGTIEDQTARVMENLKAVLAACQLSLADIVKTTIFLTDMADFTKVNAVYGSYFSQQPPARSTVQVAALPKGARVEIEAVASQD